jgi:hypothetical protein
MASESSDPFGSARDRLNDTIKWLAVALGALTTALIAGLSLKDLSSVSAGHLIYGLVGLIVGIFSIFAIIGTFVWLLIPKQFSLSQLENDSKIREMVKKSAPDILPPGYATLDVFLGEFRESMKRLGDEEIDPKSEEYEEERKFLADSNSAIAKIISYAHIVMMIKNLKIGGVIISVLSIFALIGIFVFAYFSGSDDKPSSTSRSEVSTVEFVPGREWADLAKAFSGACGDAASLRAQVTDAPRPGWLELMLLAPEACAGITIVVPAHITAAPAAPFHAAVPAVP